MPDARVPMLLYMRRSCQQIHNVFPFKMQPRTGHTLRNEQFHFDQMTIQQSAQIVSPECCKGCCQENLRTVRLGQSCWQHAMPRHCTIVREQAGRLLFELLICYIDLSRLLFSLEASQRFPPRASKAAETRLYLYPAGAVLEVRRCACDCRAESQGLRAEGCHAVALFSVEPSLRSGSLCAPHRRTRHGCLWIIFMCAVTVM